VQPEYQQHHHILAAVHYIYHLYLLLPFISPP
jgi:hypothetical protein